MLLDWHVHYDKYARRCLQVMRGSYAVLILVDSTGNNLGFLGYRTAQQDIDVSWNAKAITLAVEPAKKLDIRDRCFHQFLYYCHAQT
ncbi:hypothetical protein FHY18_000473 [Xanthomonas arboricola]|uniref:hypothetical protein n=1 Tax=Xanthomonas sp. 3793 TaxID=3035312 RepID=UPI00216A1586|nr:hypothetical protein [Xanthomonas sp. 3793]MCS3744943.1 hypothetical protein [Xanthomonas sp. 3793]